MIKKRVFLNLINLVYSKRNYIDTIYCNLKKTYKIYYFKCNFQTEFKLFIRYKENKERKMKKK